MAKRKTNSQFVAEVLELVGEEYTFTQDYVNSSTKIQVVHNTCGNKYLVRPDAFLSKGTRCPLCTKENRKNKPVGKRKTLEEFKSELVSSLGEGYAIKEESYSGSTKKVTVTHHCGHTWESVPSELLRSRGCTHCSKEKQARNQRAYTEEEFIEVVRGLVCEEYVFLEPYKNNYTPMKVKHTVCGSEYLVTAKDFIRKGNRCRKCHFSNRRKTHEEWLKQCNDILGDSYIVVTEYQGTQKPITLFHKKCGREFTTLPLSIIGGVTCTNCQVSTGETLVAKSLDYLGVYYKEQFRFEDLRDKLPLSIDFYLPSLKIAIEYQGIQHYKPVDIFGGNDSLQSQRKRDIIKREYLHKRGIQLVEIPFYIKDEKQIVRIIEHFIMRN